MRSVKNIKFSLFIAFMSLLASSVSFGQSKVLFSPNGGVKEQILEILDNAKCSIDASLYSFSDKSIWNSLVGASQRGVNVRLILNKSNFKDGYKSCKNCDSLIKEGGEVRFHPMTMHHKFSVIDSHCPATIKSGIVLTGSGNWSKSSNSMYDEDFLIFDSEAESLVQAVKAFESEFNFIWNYSRSFPELRQMPSIVGTIEREKGFYFTSQNMKPKTYKNRWTFTVKDGVKTGVAAEKIIEAINGAEFEVLIATAHFRRSDIYDALYSASKRGVKITLLTDGQELSYLPKDGCKEDQMNDKNLDECLEKTGIAKVKYKYYSVVWNYKTAKQMHAKYMIVDRRFVVTGSYNWSNTAEFKNLENLLTITNPSAVNSYLQNFEKISNYGIGIEADLLEEIERRKGNGPCHFEPMSLSGSQIKKIRAKISRGYCR